MVLFLIGLGFADTKDITLKGKELVDKADVVYFEDYTSVLQCSLNDLEKVFGKKIISASREFVESDALLKEAERKNVALLVVGDPFVATTHIDLFLEAKKRKISVEVVHNASVVSVIGATGLQVYKFGRTVSVSFQEGSSFVDAIRQNISVGLHTLLLLDLCPGERKFLSINDAFEKIEKIDVSVLKGVLVGCARLGASDKKIVAGTVSELKKVDWGKPPFCLVIPGKLHFVEEEVLEFWRSG